MRIFVWLMFAILSAFQAGALLPERDINMAYMSYFIFNPSNFFKVSIFLLFSILIFSYTLRETLNSMIRHSALGVPIFNGLSALIGLFSLLLYYPIISGIIVFCVCIHLLLSVGKLREKDQYKG